MDDPSLLTDVNKLVGVFIALVGSVIVAPDGTRLLLSSSWAGIQRQGNRARGSLSRIMPFLRRGANAHVRTASGTASLRGAVTITASGRAWAPAAPVDERIEALRKHITEIEGRLNDVARELRQESRDRNAAIGELGRRLSSENAELRQLINQRDRETARIDARGLPVIGFGILLSGVPEVLASIPWNLGWLLPIGGVGAAMGAVGHVVKERRQVRTT